MEHDTLQTFIHSVDNRSRDDVKSLLNDYNHLSDRTMRKEYMDIIRMVHEYYLNDNDYEAMAYMYYILAEYEHDLLMNNINNLGDEDSCTDSEAEGSRPIPVGRCTNTRGGNFDKSDIEGFGINNNNNNYVSKSDIKRVINTSKDILFYDAYGMKVYNK